MVKNGVALSMHLYIIKKTCSVGVFCDDIYEHVLYMRLIGSLDNKDSILHKTLLTATRKLENKEK